MLNNNFFEFFCDSSFLLDLEEFYFLQIMVLKFGKSNGRENIWKIIFTIIDGYVNFYGTLKNGNDTSLFSFLKN